MFWGKSYTTTAQSVVTDSDGFTFVRNGSSKAAVIIDTLQSGHVVMDLERHAQWVGVHYTKNNRSREGYIAVSRLKAIQNFPQFKRQLLTDEQVIFTNDTIRITITQKPFYKKSHVLTYSKEYPDLITQIDHSEYFGTDGEMPRTQYHQIILTYPQHHEITLPEEATADLFEPSLNRLHVFYDSKTKSIFIDGINSDGAGGYVAVWKIENGIYKGRMIFTGF